MISPSPTKCTTGKNSLLILLCTCLILLGACRKNTATDLKPTLNAANDNVLAHRPFIHVFNMLLKAVLDTSLRLTHHAVIDKTSITYDPANKLYSFHYQGDLCLDSVRRFGSFTARLDTSFFLTGAYASIQFISYFEDIHQVQASDTIRNMGTVTGGNINFRSRIDNALIKKDSVGMIRWKATLDHYVAPDITWKGAGNALVLTGGSGSGTTSLGYGFTSDISARLNDYLDCPWIRDGVIGFTVSGAYVGSGTIEFMAKRACNDSIRYDFGGTVYHWRITQDFLSR